MLRDEPDERGLVGRRALPQAHGGDRELAEPVVVRPTSLLHELGHLAQHALHILPASERLR